MSPPEQRTVPSNYRVLPEARISATVGTKYPPAHDRLMPDRVSGHLLLRWITVDALHVGSGSSVVYETRGQGELVRGTQTLGDPGTEGLTPVIPGASLKGAARSLAEALLGGGDPWSPHVESHPIGQLFGFATSRTAYASRVTFEDAIAEAGAEAPMGVARLPVAFRPRVAKGRRIYGPAPAGLRGDVPYEVVPSGVPFRGRLGLMNVTESELGLVLFCLGLDGSFDLRLGGGKFAGMGRVRSSVEGARLRTSRQPRGEALDATAARAQAERCLALVQFGPEHESTLAEIRSALGRSGAAR